MARLWVIVVLGGIGVMQLAAVPSAIDLAYHVRAGELMVRQRAVLHSDVLSWATGGGPWLDQNWGAQLLLYATWRWRVGGFPLLAALNALCTVAAWGLGGGRLPAAHLEPSRRRRAVLAGYLAAVPGFSARPRMFSVVLFAAEL